MLPLIDVKVLANLNGVLGRVQLRIGPDFVEIFLPTLPPFWFSLRANFGLFLVILAECSLLHS